MARRRRAALTLTVALAAFASLFVARPGVGQILDGGTSTTTTTTSLPGSSTTAAPSTTAPRGTSTTTTTTTPSGSTTIPILDDPGGDQPSDPAPPSPPGTPADAGDGDGGDGTGGGPRTIPADAQRIINSVVRTGPNDTSALLAAIESLVDLGLSRDEAIRVGFGRFPVAGAARYSHDWLLPRWGPGFRFHHGTDVVAAFGTPLRAVADGIATSSSSALGGLSVKIHIPDGTYFYYAHLAALPDDFESGAEVETGDIIGYVGDSGNARGGVPHLHFGIFPDGGAPTDPKPVLDQWLLEAEARIPELVASLGGEAAAVPDEVAGATTPRSLLATALLRPLLDRSAAGAVPTEILYQAAGHPSGGVSVAQAEAGRLAAEVDWRTWAATATTRRRAFSRVESMLRDLLAPAPGGGEVATG